MKRVFTEAEVELTLISALEDIMQPSVNVDGEDLEGDWDAQ